MNTKEKLEFRIKGLQNRLELVALLQRNYQRHYDKISPKHDRDTDLYIQKLNQLRRELQVLEATDNKEKKDKKSKKSYLTEGMNNIVCEGETIVVIG